MLLRDTTRIITQINIKTGKMQVTETDLKGCYEIMPAVFGDERGYFFESFQQEKLQQLIPDFPVFIQDNEAYSRQIGVIRGLHAQSGDAAQAKLVRVVKGKVIDVAVDIRKGSPTFGKHVAVELSEYNKKQLLVPRGFLHGYVVLEPDTIFVYKCDNYYNKQAEISVNVADATLHIDWGIAVQEMILSEKDRAAPAWEAFLENY